MPLGAFPLALRSAATVASTPSQIPVHRPLLPAADRLLPYLRRIDETRWYTNFGPLLAEFERRLGEHFDIPHDHVASFANGTLALTIALRAFDPPAGSVCLMPSWTFPAAAGAVLAAGMIPGFVDVERDGWALTPRRALSAAERAGNVGALIGISPFGNPVDRIAWDRFTAATGIPVVIDAAASFDTIASCPALCPGRTPLMVSLHATKPFGIGEGGLLIATDGDFIGRCRRLANFGIEPDRSVGETGVNAKLSEYAAAVGLAALDEWPGTRRRWAHRTAQYRRRLAEIPGIALSPRYGEGWVSSYCNVELECGAQAAADRLARAGIATRRWWGSGCHAQPAYRRFLLDPLPVTDRLAETVLGLPFFVDMTDDEIASVVDALAGAR